MSIVDLLGLPSDHPAQSELSPWDLLRHRITVLSAKSWENKVKWGDVEEWLSNFKGTSGNSEDDERISALFLLSQFMYFGSREVRVLLRAIYLEKILAPLIQRTRAKLAETRDISAIRKQLQGTLDNVKILGIGNPSESGAHLLYYIRQENSLSKAMFLNSSEILATRLDQTGTLQQTLANPNTTDYYFVDDVCGSGETVEKFVESLLNAASSLAWRENREIKFHYYCLFATKEGMNRVRALPQFSETSSAVFELDDTYQSLGDTSRYFRNPPNGVDPAIVKSVAMHYGGLLWPGLPGGFDGNQLLLGFHHNTPDNSLPIFWAHPEHKLSPYQWRPILKRHLKYGY